VGGRARQDQAGDLTSRITLIQRGWNARRRTKLAQASAEPHAFAGPEAATARNTLSRMLTEGKATASSTSRWALTPGVRPAGRGPKHFALAYEAAFAVALCGNNMAMILAVGDSRTWPGAGDYRIRAAKFPTPKLSRNAWRILAQSGRRRSNRRPGVRAALLASKRATHTALAKAYRGLGLRDLAAEHERLSNAPEEKTAILEPASRNKTIGLSPEKNWLPRPAPELVRAQTTQKPASRPALGRRVLCRI